MFNQFHFLLESNRKFAPPPSKLYTAKFCLHAAGCKRSQEKRRSWEMLRFAIAKFAPFRALITHIRVSSSIITWYEADIQATTCHHPSYISSTKEIRSEIRSVILNIPNVWQPHTPLLISFVHLFPFRNQNVCARTSRFTIRHFYLSHYQPSSLLKSQK